MIAADRVQLQQVLMNLMLSGIDAMKDTRGNLTVTSRRTEDGITVSDSSTARASACLQAYYFGFPLVLSTCYGGDTGQVAVNGMTLCHQETGNALRRRSAEKISGEDQPSHICLRSHSSLAAKRVGDEIALPERCEERLRLTETAWIRAHNIAASAGWSPLTCLQFLASSS
jgi:hypothetical protein